MSCFQVRTDLALEARESITDADGELRGVRVEESRSEKSEVQITRVIIDTKNGAKAMGKPMGTYVTLEAPALIEPDEDYHREVSEELAKQLRRLIPEIEKEQSILVVGLGNRDVTADALGPEKMHQVSSIVPGVTAMTGMETAEIVKGVVDQTKPDALIVVDALAARSTKRLNRTIQVSDAGIHPGSGVGNHRNAITKESLGVPVIAIGVPTVVDAATIVGDAIESMLQEYGESGHFFNREHPKAMSELNNMYVTSKDIDETVKRLSFTISEAINIALDIA